MTVVVNIKKTKRCDVYIGRGSIYGNPFIIGKDGIRKDVISKYRDWFYNKLKDKRFCDNVLALKDKSIGCYCKPDDCHGDVIAEYLNGLDKKSYDVTRSADSN